MKQTVKLPDIPVPGTSVVLTNVTVTVEPLTPEDAAAFAARDAALEKKNSSEE
jgi:hypothetical protein